MCVHTHTHTHTHSLGNSGVNIQAVLFFHANEQYFWDNPRDCEVCLTVVYDEMMKTESFSIWELWAAHKWGLWPTEKAAWSAWTSQSSYLPLRLPAAQYVWACMRVLYAPAHRSACATVHVYAQCRQVSWWLSLAISVDSNSGMCFVVHFCLCAGFQSLSWAMPKSLPSHERPGDANAAPSLNASTRRNGSHSAVYLTERTPSQTVSSFLLTALCFTRLRSRSHFCCRIRTGRKLGFFVVMRLPQHAAGQRHGSDRLRSGSSRAPGASDGLLLLKCVMVIRIGFAVFSELSSLL